MKRDWKLFLWGASSAWCSCAVIGGEWWAAAFFLLLSGIALFSAGASE